MIKHLQRLAFSLAFVFCGSTFLMFMGTGRVGNFTVLHAPVSHTEYRPAAVCDQAAPYQPLVNSQGANFPSYACVTGTNMTFAELSFADTETEYIWLHYFLPSDWDTANSTIKLRLIWRTAAVAGNVVWQAQTAFVTVGDGLDPSWNTAQIATVAAQGVTLKMNTATIASLTTTGSGVGKMFLLRLLRDPAHASDTLGVPAFLIGIELTYTRAQ